MEGLLQKAKAPAPEEQPQQGVEGEQMDGETRQIYDTVVAEATQAVMSEKFITRLLNDMSKSDQPLKRLAQAAVRSIDTLDSALEGSIPGEVISNACVAIAHKLIMVAVDAGLLQDNQENAEKVMSLVLAEIMKTYEISPEEMQQMAPEGAMQGAGV